MSDTVPAPPTTDSERPAADPAHPPWCDTVGGLCTADEHDGSYSGSHRSLVMAVLGERANTDLWLDQVAAGGEIVVTMEKWDDRSDAPDAVMSWPLPEFREVFAAALEVLIRAGGRPPSGVLVPGSPEGNAP